ncbi:MAG: DNA-3-methyladenine glycosylase [Synechococcus sp.]
MAIASFALSLLLQSFFARPAEVVGPDLVGCRLLKRQEDDSLLWGVVVETEAYSQDEPACHGYRRRSPQHETLFGEPGRCCHKYRHHAKGASKCHWGSRMLKRLVAARGAHRSKRKRVSPGQQQLPFVFDCRLNQIPDEWHQVAVRFRRANGIRDGDRERCYW